ncbi:MAG TPA: hypothetical protein VJU84_06465 [Pyrinomonadaceae bacterium]|nr:hypothetical protein [Pyrinomonadaceae bacterium]
MSFYVHLKRLLVLSMLCLVPLVASGQQFPSKEAAKMLPDRAGEFRAAGPIKTRDAELFDERERRRITSWASREYLGKDGQRFSGGLSISVSDAAAYSRFVSARTSIAASPGEPEITSANVGSEGFSYWNGLGNTLIFVKGRVHAGVSDNSKSADTSALQHFARTLAETVDKGDGEIPVLMKHLPAWPSVQNRSLYIIDKEGLKEAVYGQPILDAVSFDGGTEVAIANYQGPDLVLIEFKTPQIATDNDTRIVARLQELRASGQAVPAAYRRVGNYSVFVFDAPNEQAANQLIDQVQYQQVVQWLGRNPTLYDKAANEFTRTTLGVFIAVVKASGLVIIGSLAVGGLLGALLFRVRRKQQRMTQAFSDAGGMLRLNIDELNATQDPARLIGPGN